MTQSTKKRGLMRPVIGGVTVLVVIVALILFYREIWKYILVPIGHTIGNIATDWVPQHWSQFFATLGFAVVAFAINWIAHVRGRLRAWIFAIVLEVGLWILFWFPWDTISLNKLFHLNIEPMSFWIVVLSAFIVVFVTGIIFWFLEAKEEWDMYRRRHNENG